jgi:tetratricopeptide (TPR) repeat protein
MEEAFSPTGLTELLVCDHASPPSETQAGLEEEETLPVASPPGDVEDESPRPGPHGVRGLDCDLPREVPPIVSEITLPPCPGETRTVEGPESIGEDLASSGLNLVEEEPATDTGAGSLPDRKVDHDAPWVEASIVFDVRERHEGGLFVADTNLGRTGGWPEADLFRSATATTLHDPAEIIVPRTRPTPGRSRRTSTRPSTSRARPRHETGPAPVAAPSRSAPIDPPREAPTEGPNVKDPARRLPTAREILSANRAARSGARSSRPATGRRLGTEPSPTICREPAHWTIPLWLGWFPALVVALVLGATGLALAWGWSIEAKHAGVIANRLVRGGTKIDPLPEWLTPPEPKWWKTTPGHLALWALERDRTPNDPAAVEEVGQLLSAAAHASPLQPIVRFALARSAPGPAGAANELGSSLALSRDVLALAWTGHQLLAAGKKEAALKAYRAAIEMAAKADLTRLAAPAFFDDPKIRRYALPAEDLIGPIIRDMAGHGGWAYAEWSKALPPFAIAPLVAARVLRDQSVSDADAALDAILGQPDAPPAVGASDAVHLAVHAEALALKGNWAEAEEHYRRAIDRLPEGAIRRSWWINLAEIAYQRNDESNRQKALESAKGGDPNEEITRKAVELLKDYGARTEKK